MYNPYGNPQQTGSVWQMPQPQPQPQFYASGHSSRPQECAPPDYVQTASLYDRTPLDNTSYHHEMISSQPVHPPAFSSQHLSYEHQLSRSQQHPPYNQNNPYVQPSIYTRQPPPHLQSAGSQPSPHSYRSTPPPPVQFEQPKAVRLRFSGTKKTILNSIVPDQWGRTIFSVNSNKRQTVINDSQSRITATIDWHHSSPVMSFRGFNVKIKDFMPYSNKKKARTVMHNGVAYDWIEQPNGEVYLLSGGAIYASWRDTNQVIELDVTPHALQAGMLEICFLGVFLMNSGKPFGDVHKKSSGSVFDPAIMAGLAASQSSGLF